MKKSSATLSQVRDRLQNLEEQVRLMDKKLQFQSGLPHFEFVIESEGEELWSGMDLLNRYPQIFQKYPDRELVISWRSSPVTLI
ncbi:MAG: hypothetical protein HQK63_03025 [Desulfamplus sp.]|nr:hypothetical protein [Desulfamplus sp.]